MVVGRNGKEETPGILRASLVARDFGSAETVVWWAAHEDETGLLCDMLRDPAVQRNSDTADPNGRGATPFYVAVYKGNLQTVKIMCDLGGVDVNAPCRGNFGATPLYVLRAR